MKESRLLYATRAEELKANAAKRAAARGGTPVTPSVTPTPQPTATILGKAVTPIDSGRQVTGYTVGTQYKTPIVKTGYEVAAEEQRANDFSVSGNPAALQSPQPPQPTQNAPTSPVQPSSPSQGTFYNEYNKQTYKGAAAARGAARAKARGIDTTKLEEIQNRPTTVDVPVLDSNGNMTGTQKREDPTLIAQKKADLAAEQARVDAQKEQSNTEMQQTKEQTSAASQQNPLAGMFDATEIEFTGILESLNGLDPAIKNAFLPSILTQLNQIQELKGSTAEIISTFRTDDQIKADYAGQEDRTKLMEKRRLEMVEKDRDLKLRSAQMVRDIAETNAKMIEHNNTIEEQKLYKDNVQNEKKLRRQLNALGIETDLQGLSFLQTKISEGEEALRNLKTFNDLEEANANLQAGEGYRIAEQEILNEYEGKYMEIEDITNQRLDAITNAITMSKSERDKGIRDVLTKAAEDKNKLEMGIATDIGNAQVKMMDVVTEAMKSKMEKEQMGWSLLNSAYDNYKTNIPQGILDRVSELTGVGVDQLRARAAGGGGGIGGMYSQGGEAGTPSPYPQMTKAELSAAIKRAFSPANYGGTAGERTKKTAEYLGRVSSGEDTGSILRDLSADYWASQKGPGKTAHTERVMSQGSSESLQSFVDFYGLSQGDDGPLGPIDARWQGLKSVVGLSSEEYNNLAVNVGNIRARIVKDNYGAAVTPQELNLARSYIPDMTDKGAIFITKLANLKTYQQYLDAKVTADALGLPMPTPPSPVTLSGDKMSGPSKFSTDDILSTILD